MLTSTGYIGGLLIYTGSAVAALILFNLWFLRHASSALRALLSFPLAGLLLTPAYIQAGAETMAPALVVLAFQWLSHGAEAAEHALRPLMLFTGVAFLVGLIAAGILHRRRRNADAPADLDISAGT